MKKEYINGLIDLIKDELNIKQVFLKENIFTGDIIVDMSIVREICSDGLKQRQKASIPVRQPLMSITIVTKKHH